MRNETPDSGQYGSCATKNCLDEEKIAAYLDGRLAQSEVKDLKQHSQECDSCFYSLARAFKSHQRLESKEIEMASTPSWLVGKAISLEQSPPQTAKPESVIGIRYGLKQVLLWLKQGLLSPVPGYALAGIFLLLFLWQPPASKSRRLVNVPETTGLWVFKEVPVNYRNNGASRFMVMDESNAIYHEPNFSGLKVIEKKDEGLLFTWPKMEDTAEYHFTLFYKDPAGKRVLVSIDTRDENYLYIYDKFGTIKPNYFYNWEVSGKYGKGLHFKAKGSFFIVNS